MNTALQRPTRIEALQRMMDAFWPPKLMTTAADFCSEGANHLHSQSLLIVEIHKIKAAFRLPNIHDTIPSDSQFVNRA